VSGSIVVDRRGAGGVERELFVPGERRLAVPVHETCAVPGRLLAGRVLAYLLYDGRALAIAAALADVPVTVDGAPVSGGWTRVPVPSTIRAGAVELGVTALPLEPTLASAVIAGELTEPCARPFESEDTVLMIPRMERVSSTQPAVASAEPSTPGPGSWAPAVAAQQVIGPTTRTMLRPRHGRGARMALLVALGVGALVSVLLTGRLLMGLCGPLARPAAHPPAAGHPGPGAPANVTGPAATPSSSSSPPASAAAKAAPARASASAERRAVDLVAKGDLDAAAAAYRELARQHPERPVFADAAAHVERREVVRGGQARGE
jgi:hypothetical protein